MATSCQLLNLTQSPILAPIPREEAHRSRIPTSCHLLNLTRSPICPPIPREEAHICRIASYLRGPGRIAANPHGKAGQLRTRFVCHLLNLARWPIPPPIPQEEAHRSRTASCLRPGPIAENPHGKAGQLRRRFVCRSNSGSSGAVPLGPESGDDKREWDEVLGRLMGSGAPPILSDVVWPPVGGFVAMATMGFVDTMLAPKGLSFTLGSFGPVCVLLFVAPKTPGAQKYNVFVSHLGCAAVGVLALAIFGPGWVARGVALAAAIAFMQYTGSLHPPAAGLSLIMIDVQKLHHLRWWYIIFPGFVGCAFLFLLQEAVQFLKDNWRF